MRSTSCTRSLPDASGGGAAGSARTESCALPAGNANPGAAPAPLASARPELSAEAEPAAPLDAEPACEEAERAPTARELEAATEGGGGG